ncbi:ABC transporter substrate-binding protein [Ramlibacter rhizophilus]|uniref:ABC transporter substrate-binding protein n=1 Tax=Ramlibacter rhizophilus TaxID=1781167 RepID=A0A4Z0C214_9BURK|nr:ABC transporter substrate-binding protein [Ramlibacter rhizophilus]
MDDWETLTKANSTYTSLIYEGLADMAADGVTLRPKLAASWKESPGKLEITLKPGVTFHDGTPFDAAAVVKNLERVRDTPSQWRGVLNPVEKFVVVSPTRVDIHLKRPAPNLLPNLARRGAYMVSPKALDDGSYKTHPVGTGPWKFEPKDSVKGLRTVVNWYDGYHDPKSVGPRRIEVTHINDPDSLYNALRTGQVDIVWTSASIAKRAEREGMKTTWFPSVLWHLQMMDTVNTFNSPKLRKAICHAMNPQDYLDAALGGNGKVHTQRLRQGNVGYSPDVKGYPHDLAKAKALMAELGNPKVEFTLATFDSQRTIAELFKAQMAQIGVDVKLDIMTFGQFFSTFRSGKYPAAILTDSQDTGPYDYYLYHFAPTGAGNPLKTTFPAIESAVKEALAASDPAAQNAAWQKMIKVIDDEALDCGFFDYTAYWAYNPKRIGNVNSTVGDVAVFRYPEVKVLAP